MIFISNWHEICCFGCLLNNETPATYHILHLKCHGVIRHKVQILICAMVKRICAELISVYFYKMTFSNGFLYTHMPARSLICTTRYEILRSVSQARIINVSTEQKPQSMRISPHFLLIYSLITMFTDHKWLREPTSYLSY